MFYFYEPGALSGMVLKELERLREYCIENQEHFCENVFFRFDRKGFLRLFMNILPIENLEDIIEHLKERIKEKEEIFGDIYVRTRYNPRSKVIIAKTSVSVSHEGLYIRVKPQFHYYNFSDNSRFKEKKLELIELNVKDICYRAIEEFYVRQE